MDSSVTDQSPESLDYKALQAENESLKQELEALRQEVENQEDAPEKLKELAARAQADLQNAKDRLEREAQDMRKFAVAGLLSELLPTLDNFQRAFEHLPEDLQGNDWVQGVEAVEKELLKLLEDAGLQKIESLDQVADPLKHEVLQAGPGEKDVVTEVFEDGYECNGRVLRPAKVKVGNGEEA